MPTVIPVKFSYIARDLWFDPAGTGAQEGDHVICATERGQEIGLATADAREVAQEELSATIGHAQLREVVRIATDEDLERADELARRGEESMPAFRRHVTESGLDMKPVGVEYLFDGEKAVCYFAAEERVDFRQLVRDLSREFHVRIDMRQIGVREEAAIVGGYGHCGQELCCRRFATGFDPVSIRMAKEQDLPLNSTKISGACGRLMCCLRYEFEAYRDFKSRAPKRNAVIDTPLGKGKIVEYDTPKEQICLRLENGKQIRVALADMTASEAAHKKSEELGCPCRPDTVTREVLDRLESPDVQMALAELDRKNGVLAEPEVDAADLFVEPKRRRRRSANGAPSGEKGGRPAGGSASSGGEGAPTARRRRKRRPGDGGAPVSEAAEPQQASRRRRHHQAGEGEAAGQGQQQVKRTRRPGDKGGQAAAGSQPRGMQPSRKKQGSQQQGGQPGADGAAPKRRRRRRGGRGRGGSGEGGAPAGE
ncbi:PSP1 domain-containing protein [Thermophilibacter sp.]|uniref:PSP1 domain-containing protein n=1 Tax=Thermophilibacter sp. TaxID=2847309 RepID=UPI003A92F885